MARVLVKVSAAAAAATTLFVLLAISGAGVAGGAPVSARASAAKPVCAARSLRLDKVGGQGFVSHREWDFALRNVGPVTCQLKGYPKVRWLDAGAHVIAGGEDHHGSVPAAPIVLPPWHRAFFSFVFVVGGPCIPNVFTAYGLRVVPPGDAGRLVYYAGLTSVCRGNPSVTAILPHL